MDISNLTSQSLFNLLSLAEKKEELIQIIAEIDSEIIRTLKGSSVSVVQILDVVASPRPATVAPAQSGAPAPKAPKAAKAPKAPKAKAGRSGGLKDRILALLAAAGPNGLRVKEIAEKLKAKPTNIAVWFSTTGKNLTTKIVPGRYASKAVSTSIEAPAASAKPAKVAASAKPGKVAASAKPGKVAASAKPGKVAASAKPGKAQKKSNISTEARAKMAAAATARWAAVRAAKTAPAAPAKAAKVASAPKASKKSKA